MPIPWYTGATDAYAQAERARRQLGAITDLAGMGAGALRRGVTEYQDEQASPELERLRAALGIQEQKAITQSQHPTEAAPALTETATSPGPWAEGYVPGDTKTLRPEVKPTVPTPGGPLGSEGAITGSLRRLGGVGMAALGLPSPAAHARALTLARLSGQVERQKLQAGLAGRLGRTIAGAQDPAAAIAALTRGPGGESWTGLHPGDIPMAAKPPSGRAPTPLELQLRDDPAAKAALAAETARQKDIRGASRSAHKTQADLAVEAAAGDQKARDALDFLNPYTLGATYREEARRKAAESHPESDQGGSQTPPLTDPDAEDVKGQYEKELGGHPTRQHAAQRKAAIIRSTSGIALTE